MSENEKLTRPETPGSITGQSRLSRDSLLRHVLVEE